MPLGEKGGAKPGNRALTRRRTTKIHALTDRDCRPIAFLLTGGQVPDCVAADMLDEIGTAELVHGDKGYYTNAIGFRSTSLHTGSSV